jgi:MuDR family transposase
MDVGVHYSHVVAFRRALSHYTVINDFEFNLGKSEPSRVTATCASRDCNWRIHATVVEDGISFIVRTLQAKHTYYGVNTSGNKHDNKGWIIDRIVGDLRKEEDVSAKELKQRVETKFSISLP